MDFDAIRRVAWGRPRLKKAGPKATQQSKPPPRDNHTPGPLLLGPPQGLEGFHPNNLDNYSHQDYLGLVPIPQEYSESCYGNPRMNSTENYRQICYYPDHSMGTSNHPDGLHYNFQSHPGHITTSGGRRGISGPPPRLALAPPGRHIDHYQDHDHHHGHGQFLQGHSYGSNHYAPMVQEFGPGAYCPPQLIGPPPSDSYHFHGGSSRAQHHLPTYGNCFSDE